MLEGLRMEKAYAGIQSDGEPHTRATANHLSDLTVLSRVNRKNVLNSTIGVHCRFANRFYIYSERERVYDYHTISVGGPYHSFNHTQMGD